MSSQVASSAPQRPSESSHELERSLPEQELLSSLSWLIHLRWIAGAGVLVATWFSHTILEISIRTALAYLLGLGLLLYNGLLGWTLGWLNRQAEHPYVTYQWFTRIQIGLDWLAMTLLIHASGGIESPAILFFFFHIPIASLLLPHDRGFLYVTFAPLLLGGVALLEYYGVLPHVQVFTPSRYDEGLYIAGTLFFFSTAAYVMAYFSMSISRRLRQREDELAGLYRSVQATTSTLELPEVLNRLAEATTRALHCKGAVIRLLDKTGSHLEVAGAFGLSQAYLDKDPIEVARAAIDQEALTGHTVLVPDTTIENRLRYPEKVAAEGIRSILSTPLMGKRGPIGVLRAYGRSAFRFNHKDASFLSAIAAEGSVAIENAQAYQLLENLDQQKSQFVRIVTHELRSPVQVTSSLLNVLGRGYVGALNEKQMDLVDRAHRRIQFLQTLIDDLLDLAAGKAEVLATAERGLVSLNAVLYEVYQRYESAAKEKGLILECDCPGDLLSVWGDRSELDRILNNLVSNAVKYTQQGHVRVRIEQTDGMARIRVSDTGIGIPQDALSHLYEEFYRAQNAKNLQATGTGLGLAIVKDLVERYDGTIDVESAEGAGTTFTLTLPLARQQEDAPQSEKI
jgi:signal transduction histidine kinase